MKFVNLAKRLFDQNIKEESPRNHLSLIFSNYKQTVHVVLTFDFGDVGLGNFSFLQPISAD